MITNEHERYPILTAKQGDNSDLFPDILALYVPEGSHVLDMTYGNGTFWKNVDRSLYTIWRNDIDPNLGDYSYDFTDIGRFIADRFDVVVFDPPYASRSSNKNGQVGSMYNNQKHGIATVEGMMEYYKSGMGEASVLLKEDGILIVKCQDEISSGKQQWNHITLLEIGGTLGYLSEDLFVMVRSSTPIMRHSYQLHARKNHSYFLVVRKK